MQQLILPAQASLFKESQPNTCSIFEQITKESTSKKGHVYVSLYFEGFVDSEPWKARTLQINWVLCLFFHRWSAVCYVHSFLVKSGLQIFSPFLFLRQTFQPGSAKPSASIRSWKNPLPVNHSLILSKNKDGLNTTLPSFIIFNGLILFWMSCPQ